MSSLSDTDQMRNTSLSSRGKRMLQPAISYIGLHMDALADPYKAKSNPGGYISLAVAENVLAYEPLFKEKFAKIFIKRARASLEDQVIVPPFYGNTIGHDETRAAIAELLTLLLDTPKTFKFDPSGVVFGAGCGSLLDHLAWALCEEGDSLIVPSPYYSAFPNDFGSRSGAKIIDAPQQQADGTFALTEEALEMAYQQGLSNGKDPRILVITNPQNPTGTIIPEKELTMALLWARKHGLQIVSDEIYAKVVHSPDVGPDFVSMATVALKLSQDGSIGEDVHLMHGMSKAYAISGHRIGFLYSENKDLITAVGGLNMFSTPSAVLQELVCEVANDMKWNIQVLDESAKMLREACEKVMSVLDDLKIPYVRPTASLFLSADFSRYLQASTYEAENELLNDVFSKCKVLLTPGQPFHFDKPGWMRICYAACDLSTLEEALNRLQEYFLTHTV